MRCCYGDCWGESDDESFRKTGLNNPPKKTTIQTQIVPKIPTPQHKMYLSKPRVIVETSQKVVQSFRKPISVTFDSFPQCRSLDFSHPTHTLRDKSPENAPYAIMREPKFIEKTL